MAALQDSEAHYHAALQVCQQGRFNEAVALLSSALALAPDQARLHGLLGQALVELGRADEALAAFDRAIALAPENPVLFGSRGDTLVTLGRIEEAVQCYDRALTLDPNSVNDWCNRGAALNDLGRHDEAVEAFSRAIRLAPDFAPAYYNQGHAQIALQRHDLALASFDRAIELQPNYPDAHNNRANALDQLGRRPEALASVEAALALDPDHYAGLVTRAVILRKLGRIDEALVSCDRALQHAPDSHDALAVRADLLVDLEQFEEATRFFDRIIALDPVSAGPKWNKSVICLGLGRFDEGWALYEHRWAGAQGLVPRPYDQARWNGAPFEGPLLVWGEQGLGDEILHASIIPDVLERVGDVVLEVESRLVPLFQRSFAGSKVVPLGPELFSGKFTAQLPIASLGRLFRPNWETFPQRECGYLIADQARARELRQRLADGRHIVGLSWVSKAPVGGEQKSARLTDFAPLLRSPDLRFVDLQYGDTLHERQAVEDQLGVRVEKLEDIDNTNDLDSLAALMAACDAVVTVSNTTAHLAGALGRPTWVMVPHGHARIWYWFRDRDKSPWYARVRVLRQQRGQSWSAMVADVATEVHAIAC